MSVRELFNREWEVSLKTDPIVMKQHRVKRKTRKNTNWD